MSNSDAGLRVLVGITDSRISDRKMKVTRLMFDECSQKHKEHSFISFTLSLFSLSIAHNPRPSPLPLSVGLIVSVP